jgi:hypothetical protein
MTGARLLIMKSIMVDCCPLRQSWIEKKYGKKNCTVLHEILLGEDKRYHCGLLPCMEDK